MSTKALKKFTIIFIFFIVLFGEIVINIANADNQNVSLKLTPCPPIDITLATGETKVNMDNFESDIKKELQELGVDTSNLKVSAMETVTNEMSSTNLNLQQIVANWETYGAHTWTATNSTIYSYTPGGQSYPSYWGTALLNPNGYGTKEYKATFRMNSGGQLNNGVCFNVTKNSDGTLNGYFIAICNHTDTQCRLFRFNHYNLNQAFNSGINEKMSCGPHHGCWEVGQTYSSDSSSYTVLAGWSTGSSNVDYDISYKDGVITVKVAGTQVAKVTDTTYKEGTYGFWGNNCEMTASMVLSNITVTSVEQKTKKFSEVLRDIDYRDESLRFLVDVEDYQNIDLSNNSIFGELVSKMLNEGIYFVAWGNNNNKTQFENLIKLNGGNGKFLNSSYNTNISSTASYIKEIIGSLKSSQYVVLNEPLAISADPPNVLNNTIDTKWPYGKWRIDHNYTYFTNDLGQFSNANRYINDFITVFDKVGEFKATYEDIPINPTSIYVHRRPVASFDMEKNGTSVTLTSDSKDLDTNKGTNGNGIQQEEWKWIDTSTNTWHTEKLSSISTSKDYIVQLRAKDYQETWSLPVSKYITSNTNVSPIALFNFESSKISKYENLQIKDESYDPAGRNITTRKWEVVDSNGRNVYTGTGNSPLLNYNSKGIGKYTMYLTVTNSANKTSEKFGRSFEITNDVIAPEVVVNPADSDWAKSVNVSMTFTDRGGSNFKSYKYAITDSEETPTVWENEINKSTDTIVIADEGIKYLHIIGYDNDNNASAEKVLGPYKIDKTGPTLEIRTEENTGKMEAIIEDKGAGIEKYKIDIEGENAGGKITHTTDWVTKYKEKQKITHSWEHLWVKGDVKVKAVDIVGNENEFTARISNTDDSKPTVTLKTQPTYKGTETCPACGQEAHKVSWVAEFKDDKSGAPWYLENSSAQVDGVNGETNIGHLVMEKTVRQGELEGLYEESMYIHLPYIYQYKSAQYPRIWIDQYMNESDVLWINWNININR